jgi:leader peptidase (prepilin peptidase)/N-methyltransferase
VIIAVVITLAFINHDHLVVPNRIIIPATACGLAAAMALDPRRWWQYAAGCLGAGLLALLLSAALPGATRFSQAKMAFLLGAVLGPQVLVAVPIAVLIGIFGGIAVLFSEKYRLRTWTLNTKHDNAKAEVMRWL